MNLNQENRLKMCQNVKALLKNNNEIVKTLPAYSPLYEALETSIGKIKILSELQVINTSGLVKHKKQLKQVLALKTFSNSAKLQAYARFTKNEVLLNEVSFSESQLKYASDEKLREYANVILARVNAHIAELESYGITAETQTNLQAAIDNFTEVLPKIGLAAAAGKENTIRIKQAFAGINKILQDLDAIIEILKEKMPDFYNEYKRVRKIDNSGRGHLIAKGLITDAQTGLPLPNVLVTFSLKKNGSIIPLTGNGIIRKKSALKGGFHIKSMPSGIYEVSISKNGYVMQNTTLAVTNGEMATLNIALVKAN